MAISFFRIFSATRAPHASIYTYDDRRGLMAAFGTIRRPDGDLSPDTTTRVNSGHGRVGGGSGFAKSREFTQTSRLFLMLN